MNGGVIGFARTPLIGLSETDRGGLCLQAFGAATLKALSFLSFAKSDRCGSRSKSQASLCDRAMVYMRSNLLSSHNKNYCPEIMNHLNKGHFLHALPFFL